jgi:hypothetical protein
LPEKVMIPGSKSTGPELTVVPGTAAERTLEPEELVAFTLK